jgi:beta-lactamase superfamily II metal-dependent hydrolase
MAQFKYASVNEAPVYESVVANKGKKIVNTILMGTYITILGEDGDWFKVNPFRTPGWMHKDCLSDAMGLKVFFLDVGQGDGMLIEAGDYKILVDAGPDNNMHGYLTKWQYSYLLKANKKVHIDYLVVTHFDIDHYKGFIKILQDKRFTFGTICHPGILKFAEKNSPYSTGLGNTIPMGTKDKLLVDYFDNLVTVNNTQPFNMYITPFIKALKDAYAEGRIHKTKRMGAGDNILKKKMEGQDFVMEVLAPFMEKAGTKKGFLYWNDDGKTINGHSLVVKLTFGARTILLGGDLNTVSEKYLMQKYAPANPFEVDVAKSCHHGSSEFTEAFMQQISPYATVISSGDNEGHAHPRADAIGCAGKYSKSKRPLVYSTELARSTNLKSNTILFGMINLRSNGKDIFISQMKEVKDYSDLWDSYEVK